MAILRNLLIDDVFDKNEEFAALLISTEQQPNEYIFDVKIVIPGQSVKVIGLLLQFIRIRSRTL